MIHDVITFSVFKEYLCFVKRANILIIGKLDREDQGELRTLRMPITNEVTGLRMWNGTCTLVTSNVVHVLKYHDALVCVRTLGFKTKLPFCDMKRLNCEHIRCQIYRDNLIISLETNVTISS